MSEQTVNVEKLKVESDERVSLAKLKKEELIEKLRIEVEQSKIISDLKRSYIEEAKDMIKASMVLGLGAYITHRIVESNEAIEKHRIEFGQE